MTDLYVLISNTIRLACFVLLAIAFKKWWIVFFAILFWTFLEKMKEK